MHTRISRSSSEIKLELDEWVQIGGAFEEFHITGKLIQQDPFSKEFLEFDMEGSGYWIPKTGDAPSWPGEGKVIFRKDEYGITFVQYKNTSNPVLVALAKSLNAELYLSDV